MIRSIKKAVDEIPKQSDILKAAQENATQIIHSATNGNIVLKLNDSGHPEELLIMDTNDPKTASKVWRWNVNGLGYSNSGYNGTYGLALTIDGHLVADAITVDGLEVGKNVTMGPDATISWNNVTNQPIIPSKTSELTNDSGLAYTGDIPSDNYITEITKNAVTSEFIKGLNLEVGNQITMGANAVISWNNISGAPTIPTKTSQLTNDTHFANVTQIPDVSGFQTAAQVTQITKNTISTEAITATNLTISGQNSHIKVGAKGVANGNYLYFVNNVGGVLKEISLDKEGKITSYDANSNSASMTPEGIVLAKNSSNYMQLNYANDKAHIGTNGKEFSIDAPTTHLNTVKCNNIKIGGEHTLDWNSSTGRFQFHGDLTLVNSSLETNNIVIYGTISGGTILDNVNVNVRKGQGASWQSKALQGVLDLLIQFALPSDKWAYIDYL